MDGIILELVLGGTAGLLVGAGSAWLLRGRDADRERGVADENWQRKLDQAVARVRVLSDQTTSLKVNLEETQQVALRSRHAAVSTGTELESAKEKVQSLSQQLSAARAERDEYSTKHAQGQQYALSAKRRLEDLALEFDKSRAFYKAQIAQVIEARRALERKVDGLNSEQQSLATLLASARSEYDSVSKMLASARARLENLDALEHKVIELEADNAELRHRCGAAEREADKLRRKVGDLEEIRSQNSELSRCLESMEDSRNQYEADAHGFRDRCEKSEMESESLRMKPGDIEESLSEMQRAQRQAGEISRIPQTGISAPADGEGDDLTEIVGIGKVFESMLHNLGIYYFRQIAAFGSEELARVNAELKEFKGRIEHDDWIGQARRLHHRKYGTNGSMPEIS